MRSRKRLSARLKLAGLAGFLAGSSPSRPFAVDQNAHAHQAVPSPARHDAATGERVRIAAMLAR